MKIVSLLYRAIIIFAVVGLTLTTGCKTGESVSNESPGLPAPDNRYDSEFPVTSVSKALENLTGVVKKLDCLAFYMSYTFPPGNSIDPDNFTEKELRDLSTSSDVSNESVSGTAIVVYNDGQKIGLLTCAHVIDFPDTIVKKYEGEDNIVEVIAIKLKQQNYVQDLPEGDDIEVIVMDVDNDLALLSKQVENDVPARQQVLSYPIGNVNDLGWGSVVYVMGYPSGHLMVTRAIVSKPPPGRKDRFITDALYNRGISGSPVMAIRDGAPNFEFIGMASSASAQQLYFLKPGIDNSSMIDSEQPYSGDLYIDHYKNIKYGITYNVSVNVISGFLKTNRVLLGHEGFNMELFFK